MRVVSLVPSWTETLIEAGVDVVGRTRFCVHPQGRVNSIARVGGTKDWDFARILGLKPDLLVLDREENPKFMSEQSEVPWIATHVDSVKAMPVELERLAERISGAAGSGYSPGGAGHSAKLMEFSRRWRTQLERPARALIGDSEKDVPPALLEWGRRPEGRFKVVLYVIWKDPWMAVSRGTFIGSMLERFGWGERLPEFSVKYPEVDLEDFDPKETLLLFSSEPYPFLKKRAELQDLNFPYAFVNGESLSWFGVRSLNFLESHL